jgi:hypothetical protein
MPPRTHCTRCGNPDCPRVDPDPYWKRCPADRDFGKEQETDRATFSIPVKASIQIYRALYRNIRARSEARTPQEFDAACAGLSPTSPRDWCVVATRVQFTCRRCAGTGRFITHTENGVPRGPGGDCYRCAGTGRQNDSDARRNYGADIHQIVRH